jgi:hypothetical protein
MFSKGHAWACATLAAPGKRVRDQEVGGEREWITLFDADFSQRYEKFDLLSSLSNPNPAN